MTIISARRTRSSLSIATVAALAVALSGCTSTSDDGGANLEDVVLHPSGNQGAWLSNAYAKGVGRVVELDDMLCGIQDDVAFHRDLSELGTSVIATDLATGTDLWRLETETPTGATCGTPLGDRMYTSESEIDENGAYRSIVVRVDLATGERTTIYEAPINIAYFDAFAHIDETVFARAGADVGDVLIAFDGAGLATWQTLMANTAECALLSEHIACVDPLSAELTVFDAATGEVTATATGSQDDAPVLASDGYALTTDRVSFTEATYTAYDFDGKKIGSLDSGNPPLHPSTMNGVFFELDDFNHWRIHSTDATGRPVLRTPGGLNNGLDAVATGTNLPDIEVAGISADGQTLLSAPYGKAPTLLDIHGKAISELDAQDERAQVIGGYLTVSRGTGTVIYLPAD